MAYKFCVAPARERGLKYNVAFHRSSHVPVAPARERGLKWRAERWRTAPQGRSREGAWIEIQGIIKGLNEDARRSREGAWIEILANRLSAFLASVAPARERGLKYD